VSMTVLRKAATALVPVKLPPGWTPGICHHNAHVVHDGKRFGLLFLDDDLASILPCLHIGKDGQP
jgi:hypothetical protein